VIASVGNGIKIISIKNSTITKINEWIRVLDLSKSNVKAIPKRIDTEKISVISVVDFYVKPFSLIFETFDSIYDYLPI